MNSIKRKISPNFYGILALGTVFIGLAFWIAMVWITVHFITKYW